MKVLIDRGKCVGAGQCVRVAPEVFDQDEKDGLVMLIEAQPGAKIAPFVRKAARLCPVQAILIVGDNPPG